MGLGPLGHPHPQTHKGSKKGGKRGGKGPCGKKDRGTRLLRNTKTSTVGVRKDQGKTRVKADRPGVSYYGSLMSMLA